MIIWWCWCMCAIGDAIVWSAVWWSAEGRPPYRWSGHKPLVMRRHPAVTYITRRTCRRSQPIEALSKWTGVPPVLLSSDTLLYAPSDRAGPAARPVDVSARADGARPAAGGRARAADGAGEARGGVAGRVRRPRRSPPLYGRHRLRHRRQRPRRRARHYAHTRPAPRRWAALSSQSGTPIYGSPTKTCLIGHVV